MKRLLLALILISLLIVPVMASTQVNLTYEKGGVFNGGFETGSGSASNVDGWLGSESYGWYIYNHGISWVAYFDANVSHSGSKSLKLNESDIDGRPWVRTAPNSPTLAQLSKHATRVKPSTTYTLSGWIKNQNSAPSSTMFGYYPYTSTGTEGSYSGITMSGTNDWTYKNITFTTASTTEYIVIQCGYNTVAASSQWFDDITLEEVVTDTQSTAQVVKPVVQGVTSTDNIDVVKSSVSPSPWYSNRWKAVQFQPTKQKITGVKLGVKKTGSPTGTMTVAIETDSSNTPSGTVLASNTVDVSTFSDSAYLEVSLPALYSGTGKLWVTTKNSSVETWDISNTPEWYYANTGTEYISQGNGAWGAPLNAYKFNITTLYAKNTEDVSVTVNGVQMLLNTSTHGNIIPAMTGATTPTGYTASASSTLGTYYPWKAFDGVLSAADYGWSSPGSPSSPPQWLQIDLPQKHILTNYTLFVLPDTHAPRDWKLEGSNDSFATKYVLDSQTSQTWSATVTNRSYPLSGNTVAFNSYRLNVSATIGGTYVPVVELQLFEADNADGLLSGAIVDTDKGFYNWTSGITSTTGGVTNNEVLFGSSVYSASNVALSSAYGKIINGWNMYLPLSGKSYIGLGTNSANPYNITWKVNTVLPTNTIDVSATYYVGGGEYIAISSDNINWITTPLTGGTTWQTRIVTTNNFVGNNTIYVKYGKDTTYGDTTLNSISINATLNTTGLPVQSVIAGTNYYNISSNGRADSASLDPSMQVKVWLMGQRYTGAVAAFTQNKTSGAAPLSVLFTDTSTNRPKVWNWSVNNTDWSSRTWYNYTTSTNLVQTFTTAGIYNITLSVQNVTEDQTISTVQHDIRVNSTLAADFTGSPLSGTPPQLVSFVDYSTGAGIYAWNWSFGDGYVNSTRNPTHTYSNAVSYTVSLIVTGADGTDTETKSGYITISPMVASSSGTPTSGTAPLSVTFTGSSTGTPDAWYWEFGDGGTSVLQNPVYDYNVFGTYSVNMRATNIATGAYDWVNKTDYIIVIPMTASFTGTPVSGTAPLVVSFTGASTGNPDAWYWDFGDGSTSAVQNPIHSYTILGNKTVSFKAMNVSTGEFDWEIKTAYIHVLKNASTTLDIASYPKLVQFHVQTIWGEALPDALITIQGITTTTGSYDWVMTLIGIPLDEAPIESTLLSGTTDSNGNQEFMMVPTTKYNVTTTLAGQTFPVMYIVPHDGEYTIVANLILGEGWVKEDPLIAGTKNITVSKQWISDTSQNVIVNYEDTTGTTTGGLINITQGTTILYSGTIPNSSFTITQNVVVPLGGTSVKISVDAISTQGNVSKDYATSFDGPVVGAGPFDANLMMWVSFFLLMLTAMLAGATSAPKVAIIVCIEGWLFIAMGWLRPLALKIGDDKLIAVFMLATALAIIWNLREGKRMETGR